MYLDDLSQMKGNATEMLKKVLFLIPTGSHLETGTGTAVLNNLT